MCNVCTTSDYSRRWFCKLQLHSFCTECMCSLQTSNRLTSEMRDPDGTRSIINGHQVSDLNLQIGEFDPGLDNFSPVIRGQHRKLCKDRMDRCMQGLVFQNRQTSAILTPTRLSVSHLGSLPWKNLLQVICFTVNTAMRCLFVLTLWAIIKVPCQKRQHGN